MTSSQRQDQERAHDDTDAQKMYDEIEELFKLEEQLEKEKRDIESKGWDLKFQNYWGYIVSAGNNFE